MQPIDFIIIGIIALAVGGAVFYIVRAKRNGQKCIGCPDSKTCGKTSCSGNCTACNSSHKAQN